MNIAQNFVETAKRLPDNVFIVDVDETPYTYAEILARASGFAAYLDARSVAAGDRVVLTFPNCVDYVCAYLGCLLRGCTITLVDFRALPQHVDFVRRDAGAKCWVSPGARPAYAGIPDHVPFPAGLREAAAAPIVERAAQGNPLALIIYTSGTTGTPKGVRLSHANLQHTLRSIAEWAGIGGDERELVTLSLTHLFGLAHLHVHWTLGGAVVLEESLKDAPRTIDRLAKHRITSFPGTPAGFKLILDNYADAFREAAADLRYIIINSAPMQEHYVRLLLETVPHVRCYMYYGLTEASRSTFIHYNRHPGKYGSIGTATPGARVCVGTPEHPLIGEAGEILISGPHVTEGYWNVESSEHYHESWFRSGDLGVMDEEGFLTWVGRVKEQINVDGLKVSPTEIEAILKAHPAVQDCAVVGAPDPLTGQQVVGFVVAGDGANTPLEVELRKFCKGKLEFYKIPRRIHFIEAIPRTDTGKVKRLALLERIA